mmetsp:Transcript_12255/g.22242  ORF Transcript_12255/g.22242 Transcript_12255/m.22242 type:complete len:310 (+) Transcript_12255:209-1138(+)
MISPMELDVGGSNKEGCHHARVFVGQKVTVENGFARVIPILDPNPRPAIGWDNDRVAPLVGIKVQNCRQDGILGCGELRSHFLDLEAIDVNVKGVDIVLRIDQNILASFAGVSKKIQSVRREGLAIDIVLWKGSLIPIGTHGKDNGFCFGDIFRLDGFVMRVSRSQHHVRYWHRGNLGTNVRINSNGGEKLVMRVSPHVKELHPFNALLANDVFAWFIELQEDLLSLSTGQHQNGSFPWFLVHDSVRTNHPEGNGGVIPVFCFFSITIDDEGIFILNCGTENSQMKNFFDSDIEIGRHDAIHQKGMNFG